MQHSRSLLLALIGLVTLLSPLTASADNWNNTLSYSCAAYDGTGTAAITGYIGTPTSIDIPSQITNGSITYDVRSIGFRAFAGCSSVTSITIPSSIRWIDFLTPFVGCSKLASISVSPDNEIVSSTDGVLFDKSGTVLICYPEGKPDPSYTIPSNVTSICGGAFTNCQALERVSIPSGITSIGLGINTTPYVSWNISGPAFTRCRNLTYVSVSEDNSGYRSVDGVLFNKAASTLIYYPPGKLDLSYTIPSSVTSIGDAAFQYSTLANIAIPSSVTSIGYGAFLGCKSLTSIAIPNSVTFINDYAFAYCYMLSQAHFMGNAPTTFGLNVFDRAASNFAIYYNANASGFTTPTWNGYPAVAINYIFSTDAPHIATVSSVVGNPTSIAFPPQITNGGVTFDVVAIDTNAFLDHTNVTEVSLPDSLRSIGDFAFFDCSALTSINIPSGVTVIGTSAFAGCTSLATVTLPNSVTAIGIHTFLNCFGLTSINIPNSVTSIGDGAFAGCSHLASINIPNSVLAIRYAAFLNCFNLSSIAIPNNLTIIGASVFDGCIRLASIDVSASNKTYSSANGVLFDKSGTVLIRYPEGKPDSTYTIPANVTSIGSGAFYNCTGLVSIVIPNSVTLIGSHAFSYCQELVEIIIPDSVSSIGAAAFDHCAKLSQARFLGNAPSPIYSDTFSKVATGFTIYYDPNATGFTSPTWNGYTTSPTLTSATLWKQKHFTAAELNNPAISGALADPNSDGVPNLLECALGRDPRATNSANTLPQSDFAEDGSMTFTYTQAANAPEFNIIPEVSTDLITWNSGSSYLSTQSDTVDGTGTKRILTVKSLLSPTTTPRQYVRLRVVQQ